MRKNKKILLIITIAITLLIIPNVFLLNNGFLIDNNNGEEIINPKDPKESYVYIEDLGYSARGIDVGGDYAYLGTSAGLAVVNIYDPTDPELIIIGPSTSSIEDIFISADYAFVVDENYFEVIDISDPTNPGAPVTLDLGFDMVRSICVSGDYAYAGGDDWLHVISISNPTNPIEVADEYLNGAFSDDIYISGNYAYIAVWDEGLAIVDISNPLNPGTPVYEDTSGRAYGVFVSGDYAYVADGDPGLAIIDISDPTNPGTPVYRDTTGFAFDVYVEGDHAYVADRESGLAVIDISDPTNPGLPVYEAISGNSYDIFVSGNYAYLAGSFGLAVIDLLSEMVEPIIIDSPNDFLIKVGYSGVTISWTALDENPDTYTIELEGTGIVDGPTAWSSGVAIIYNVPDDLIVPDGLSYYEYTYTVNISDDYGNFITDGVTITVQNTSALAFWAYLTEGAVDSSPALGDIDGDEKLEVIIGSDDGKIYVINGEDGTEVWNYPTGDKVFSSPALGDIDADGKLEIVVGSVDGKIYALNGESGSVRWQYDAISNVQSSPALADIDEDGKLEVVFGQTFDGKIIALNGENGGELWTYPTGYVVDSSPAIGDIDADGKLEVVIASQDQKVYAINGEDGSLSWSYTLDWYISGSPALGDVDGDGKLEVIIGTVLGGNGGVYAINGEDGSQAWNFTVGNQFRSSPAIGDIDGDGTAEVVVGCFDGKVYAINGEDGSEAWNSTIGNQVFSSPSLGDVDGDGKLEVVIGSDNDYLYALNGENGIMAWNFSTQNSIDSSPVLGDLDGDGKLEVVVGSTDRAIYAYKPTLSGENIVWQGLAGKDFLRTKAEDLTDPIITDAPSDFSVEYGYTGVSISWTATDLHPNNYTIELQGSGIVVGPTAWSSGVAIIYDVPDGLGMGDYIYTVNFTDDDGNFITDSVTMTVEDTTDPIITDAPSDFNVEYGYTGVSISWTATDPHPNTYTIELQGSGTVVGPTAWSSGVAIIYNVPDGFGMGDYIYIVNYTDDDGNFITDSVTMTVEDTTDPIITDAPSDFNVEYGYTGVSISWTATDLNPNTYTIELQGSGTVTGSTAWSSGVAIIYNVPDGFGMGDYIYIVNYTDDDGNFITDSVTITVGDTTDPIITDAPSDFSVEYGYTGVSISWTATDLNPNTYTIELQGPTAWSSGVAIIYNVPDGLGMGDYIYTVNFTDDGGNFITDSVTMTVGDTTDPIITDALSDFSIDHGYTGVSISWTATDLNPNTYTIELQGSGTVAGPTAWSSGVAIVYDVPDGLAVGEYIYIINFIDDEGNFITDSVTMTVEKVATGGAAIPFGNFYLIFLVIGIISLAIVQKRRKQFSSN